jgi:hypothetical protein
VSAGVVGVAYVVVVDSSAAIFIELTVSFLDEGDALWIHRALDHTKEFVVVDSAVAVFVEGTEKRLHVNIGEVEARFLAALGELLHIQGAGPVVIHDLEDAANANDRSGASREHFLTESFDEVLRTGKTSEKIRDTAAWESKFQSDN